MSHGGEGGQKIAKKCHVLFEWPLRQGMEETVDGKSFDYFDIFWVLAKQTKAERSKHSNGSK